jgi:nucleoside triphosphate pyrophosphatase
MMKVALASRSPRRRELLEQIGIDYEVIDIDIDESWNENEMPEDYVCRIAIEKARAGKTLLKDNLPILAADTAVVLDGHILGKAETKEDAMNMLEKLSGKTHEVLSAVTVISEQERTKVNISKVTFKRLTKEEIERYCDTNEPIGKAGGYAIQGKAAVFIEKLEGSYSSVMGLPLFETKQLLDRA